MLTEQDLEDLEACFLETSSGWHLKEEMALIAEVRRLQAALRQVEVITEEIRQSLSFRDPEFSVSVSRSWEKLNDLLVETAHEEDP